MTCTTRTRCVEWLTTFIVQMAPCFVFTTTLTMLGKVVCCQFGSTSHSRMARFIHRLVSLLHSSCWEALSPCQPSDAIASNNRLKNCSKKCVCSKCRIAAGRVHRLVPPLWSTVCVVHTSHEHGVGRLKSPVV